MKAAEVVLAGVITARKKTSCRPIRMIAFWLLRVDTFGAERTFRFPAWAWASRNAVNFEPATPSWNVVDPVERPWAAVAPPLRPPDRERKEGSSLDQSIPYFVESSRVTSMIRVSITTPVRTRASIIRRCRSTCSTFAM